MLIGRQLSIVPDIWKSSCFQPPRYSHQDLISIASCWSCVCVGSVKAPPTERDGAWICIRRKNYLTAGIERQTDAKCLLACCALRPL